MIKWMYSVIKLHTHIIKRLQLLKILINKQNILKNVLYI